MAENWTKILNEDLETAFKDAEIEAKARGLIWFWRETCGWPGQARKPSACKMATDLQTSYGNAKKILRWIRRRGLPTVTGHPQDTVTHSNPNGLPTVTPFPIGKERKKLKSVRNGQNNGQRRGADNDLVPAEFERFWTAYPRKVARFAALKAWRKLNPPTPLFLRIMSALTEQKGSVWADKDTQYIPHASTWLNQHRWEDNSEQQRSEPSTVVNGVELDFG